MQQLKACGFIIFRKQPATSFLLMKHRDRWDLPKGVVEPGENELQCAVRELREETGIDEAEIEIDDGFRFETQYPIQLPRSARKASKTLVVFLGWLHSDARVVPTEHEDFAWLDWNPPHHIQTQTIDPLLAKLAEYFTCR
jgi:8-oxo-dGTP pyrophosphatase MutT (NUDIX family)